jgi:hypothetical protein
MTKTYKIGWLADDPGFLGGAELESQANIFAAPPGFEVIPCKTGEIPHNLDAYVVNNCTTYDFTDIPALETAPVIRVPRDMSLQDNARLRDWLLANSVVVIMSSPLHDEAYPWTITAPVVYCPAVIDVKRYRQVSDPARAGYCVVSRLWPGKGIENLAAWAKLEQRNIDVYGFGPMQSFVEASPRLNYKGQLSPDKVPTTLARYEYFVFMPDEAEPFSRTTAEAWLAGCKLLVNQNIGALWWINNYQAALSVASDMFWQEVKLALGIQWGLPEFRLTHPLDTGGK